MRRQTTTSATRWRRQPRPTRRQRREHAHRARAAARVQCALWRATQRSPNSTMRCAPERQVLLLRVAQQLLHAGRHVEDVAHARISDVQHAEHDIIAEGEQPQEVRRLRRQRRQRVAAPARRGWRRRGPAIHGGSAAAGVGRGAVSGCNHSACLALSARPAPGWAHCLARPAASVAAGCMAASAASGDHTASYTRIAHITASEHSGHSRCGTGRASSA
jgi:hypothetical protein